MSWAIHGHTPAEARRHRQQRRYRSCQTAIDGAWLYESGDNGTLAGRAGALNQDKADRCLTNLL